MNTYKYTSINLEIIFFGYKYIFMPWHYNRLHKDFGDLCWVFESHRPRYTRHLTAICADATNPDTELTISSAEVGEIYSLRCLQETKIHLIFSSANNIANFHLNETGAHQLNNINDQDFRVAKILIQRFIFLIILLAPEIFPCTRIPFLKVTGLGITSNVFNCARIEILKVTGLVITKDAFTSSRMLPWK